MKRDGFAVTVEIDEGDRQFLVLSLALCALLRPGFDYEARQIAEKLEGGEMFVRFKVNNPQVKPTEGISVR